MAARKKNFERENLKMLFVSMALVLTFAVQYSHVYYGSANAAEAAAPVANASSDFNGFKIGQCVDSATVYGWGNKSVGIVGASADLGCFDLNGSKLENILTEEACAAQICG